MSLKTGFKNMIGIIEKIIVRSKSLMGKNAKLQDIADWLKDIDKKKTSVDMSKFDPEKISKQWIELIENA